MTSLPGLRAPLHDSRSRIQGYTIAAWLIVLLFGCLQAAHILRRFNSPSTTEARTALAGLRTLDGHGWSDGYLRTLPGSLLWPVLSGGAFGFWGTAGPRMVALALVTTGFLAILAAARALFGSEASFYAAVALALSAPFWIAGHVGSMEALALAGSCVAIWAIVRLNLDDHRGWLLLAAASLSVATLAHYRAVLLLIPASMLLAALRQRRAWIDIGLLWLLCALALVIYFDVFGAQIVDAVSARTVFELSESPGPIVSAGATRAIVAVWGVLPLLIGFGAWLRNRPLRPVIAALLIGPAIWVGLWLLTAHSGAGLVYFDLALGMVLAYPVVGLALAQLSRERAWLATASVLALALPLLAFEQTRAFDQGWPDSSAPVAALVDAVQPGEQVLSMERWPVALALYEGDRIDEPGDVLDESLLLGSDSVFDFCSFAWFVDSAPVDAWSPLVATSIGSCGTFETVEMSSSEVVTLTGSIDANRQLVQTIVQRNSQPFEADQ